MGNYVVKINKKGFTPYMKIKRKQLLVWVKGRMRIGNWDLCEEESYLGNFIKETSQTTR